MLELCYVLLSIFPAQFQFTCRHKGQNIRRARIGLQRIQSLGNSSRLPLIVINAYRQVQDITSRCDPESPVKREPGRALS